MRGDLPAGTVTFLFTDVEGSTRLLHELGAEGYAAALAEHRRVIRHACTREGGFEVDTQGDAFFFAFPTAPGALAAAAQATEALASGPVQVRVGLHTGTPLLTDEGYVGDDVHLAARVGSAGHGGQVLVSSSTAASLPSDKVSQGLLLIDLGEHRLKDIEQAVSIFQLGESSFPPLKTISNTNLPRPASSFVGRGRELGEVLARLEHGARLLTLTGPGGSGKTRLAIEAAAWRVPEYKAGVFWVGLASLRDPALVTETIAQTLGAKDGLTEHIGERELLLLLDNLEQVIEAAPELSSLLRSCPNLTLLVTSRELLRVQGEVEYPVPPLAQAEAVSLFCERSGLEPSDEIIELCTRLDSLPLAVELAAARTKALTPAQILERLSQRLDLLRGGRDADPRQQTLRATIEWSYDLLSEEEQQLFCCLSVFAGGCTLEAAEDVCEAELDTLQSLVEKSLLRFTDERFWMLETIREYAGERLSADGVAVRRRHAASYSDFVVRVNAELRGDRDDVLLDVLGAEHSNIRALLAWCVIHDPATGMRTAVGMERFWWMRGHLSEARRWYAELLARRDALPPDLLAHGLAEYAWAASEQGSWDEVLVAAEEALQIAQGIGDGDAAYKAVAVSAEAHAAAGNYSEADAAYETARDLARLAGNRYREGACIHNQGQVAQSRGDFERARALTEEALAVAREIGTQEGIVGSTIALGSILRAEGRLDESLAALRSVLPELARLGFAPKIVVTFLEISALLLDTGELERPARLLGAAEALAEEAGVEIDGLAQEIDAHLAVDLGQSRFTELKAEGFEMDLGKAIALASLD